MTFDPDAPWIVNAVLILLVLGGVPALSTWLANRGTKRELRSVAADARTAAEQTANTHDTNLRDDLDQKVARIERGLGSLADSQQATRDDVGGLHSEVRALRGDVNGVRADARQDRVSVAQVREDLNGFTRGREGAIDDLRDSIPSLVADALTQHVHDCPLRNDGNPPVGGTT